MLFFTMRGPKHKRTISDRHALNTTLLFAEGETAQKA